MNPQMNHANIPHLIGQSQQIDAIRSQIRIQSAIENTSKLLSAAYLDALNQGRMATITKIKEENQFISDEELQDKLSKTQNVPINLNLGMVADIAVKQAEVLIQRLEN